MKAKKSHKNTITDMAFNWGCGFGDSRGNGGLRIYNDGIGNGYKYNENPYGDDEYAYLKLYRMFL